MHVRKVVTSVLAFGAVLVASFLAASWAASPNLPAIPSTLPASLLPFAKLDAKAKQLMANSALGVIATNSFHDVRLLPRTSGPRLYLVPTRHKGEFCIVYNSIVCGNPDTESNHSISVLHSGAHHYLVGGGIVTPGIRSVAITNGVITKRLAVVHGSYVVRASDRIANTGRRHIRIMTSSAYLPTEGENDAT